MAPRGKKDGARRRARKQERRRVGRHNHRARLSGEQRRRAEAVGEPTAFAWVCDDPNCLRGHR